MHTIEKNTELKIIWFDGSPHQNCIEENDGGQWLLSYADNTYEEFKKTVEGYFSKNLDDTLLKTLYENGSLPEGELSELIR
jgi:hypothetical protein